MNNIFVIFWAVMVFASVTWYAFLLFYVGYKGGKEIQQMTKDLSERNARRDSESG